MPNEEEKPAELHIRAKPVEKAGWVKAARRRGMKLEPWVIEALNEEARHTGVGFESEKNQ